MWGVRLVMLQVKDVYLTYIEVQNMKDKVSRNWAWQYHRGWMFTFVWKVLKSSCFCTNF